MGSCMSARIKADSPIHAGKYGKSLTNISGKVSSTSGPNTPKTEGEILQSSNMKCFAFDDLKTATRNFRPDNVLGGGGFGCVFKGWIDESTFEAAKPGTGLVICVKRLNQGGFGGDRAWLAEINYLGQLHHPNLVKLIGYCLEDDHRLLVHEFMPRGSLEDHLFQRTLYFQPLSWSIRIKVALGAAKGLAFLHNSEASVIYYEFKTSSILLDSNYNAKLSDFGLAKDDLVGGKSHVSTEIIDTYRYAAPEYIAIGHLSTRSDVYSFGVVLLELLTGRRAMDKNRPHGEHDLVEWAKPQLHSKRRILSIMDPCIEGQYSLGGVLRAASVAVKCLAIDPKLRPKMEEVVKLLKKIQEREAFSSERSESIQSTKSSSRSGASGTGKANPCLRPVASRIHA